MTRRLLSIAVVLLAGCKPGTVRPSFPPVTGAPKIEVELKTLQATEIMGELLKGDSLPVTRIDTRDGLIETAWFRSSDRKATHGRQLGPGVVQVRAWIDPSRTGYSYITLETVYRPLADPSLAPRELDRQVPPEHPIGKRMTQIVTELARLYSDEPPPVDSAPPMKKRGPNLREVDSLPPVVVPKPVPAPTAPTPATKP